MSEAGVEIMISLATALAAGFVVGAEREQRNEANFAGVRTFPLIALAGALGSLLGTWGLVAMTLAVSALVLVAYHRSSTPADPDDLEPAARGIGMSTEVAALVTFALGALCTTSVLGVPMGDRLLLVAAGATVTLGLLSLKRPLGRIMAQVSRQDVYATTKLLLLAVIVLPLLPNMDMGPWDTLNPSQIGLLVVLISGIGFAGYVAIRIFGASRGLLLTGLLGGLASSTAVTLSFSGRAKQNPELVDACSVAIVLASGTMFPRVLIAVSAVSPEVGGQAATPFLVAAGVALACGAIVYAKMGQARGAGRDTELKIKNPMAISSALKFAALFTGVLVFSRAASFYLADTGVYISAIVTGLADADAIALSVAQMHSRGEIEARVAVEAMGGIAAAMNTFSKIGIATVLGGRRLGLQVGGALVLAIAAGAIAALAFQ